MAKNRAMAIKHAKARKEAMKEAVARSLDQSAFEYRRGEWVTSPSSITSESKQWTDSVLHRDTHSPIEQFYIKIMADYGIDYIPPKSTIKCNVIKSPK